MSDGGSQWTGGVCNQAHKKWTAALLVAFVRPGYATSRCSKPGWTPRRKARHEHQPDSAKTSQHALCDGVGPHLLGCVVLGPLKVRCGVGGASVGEVRIFIRPVMFVFAVEYFCFLPAQMPLLRRRLSRTTRDAAAVSTGRNPNITGTGTTTPSRPQRGAAGVKAKDRWGPPIGWPEWMSGGWWGMCALVWCMRVCVTAVVFHVDLLSWATFIVCSQAVDMLKMRTVEPLKDSIRGNYEEQKQ